MFQTRFILYFEKLTKLTSLLNHKISTNIHKEIKD